MKKIYTNFKIFAFLAIFCFANLMLNAQSCNWKVQLSGSYGDQISWTLKSSQGEILLSGGPYTYGFSDEKTVSNAGPVEFYIETMGNWTDNVVQYNISNQNGIVATGTLMGGLEKTVNNLKCSDTALPFSNGCLDSPYGANPATVYVPMEAGIPESIKSGLYNGEYSLVQVEAGKEYKFTSSVQSDFITIGNEAGNTILAHGAGEIIWTSNINGVIRFYTHSDAYCNYVNIFRTRYVQTGVAPENPANPNYQCFQGDGLKSNNFENAFSISADSPYRNVDDFNVAPNTTFDLKYIRLNVATFDPVSEIYFKIYENDNGNPGTNIVATTVNMMPVSQILRGYNSIGFPVYEVAVILPEAIKFQAGKYWLLPQAYTANNSDTYWEMTSTGNNGDFVKSSEFEDPWTQDSRNYNAVFFVAGDCGNLAVDDATMANFSFYPNPVVDYLNFKTTKTISELSIYNAQGQQLLNISKVDDNKINLSRLLSGLYIINTKFKDGTKESFKVIKK